VPKLNLFAHQLKGIEFLIQREGAGLFWEMGVGKSRTALSAARTFFERKGRARIDRVLILSPASVKFAWLEELRKLSSESASFDCNIVAYKDLKFYCLEVLGALNGNPSSHLPIAIISYSLLQQERHAAKIASWCSAGRTILICDESSYLKNRTAKQTKGTKIVAEACVYRWLLSGTPVTNSPLDLWAQAEVMYPLERGKGPLYGFSNWYAFRSAFAELSLRRAGSHSFTEIVGYKNLDKLQTRFSKFVSRIEKRDCLDLPAKSYTVREIALSKETWKIYNELKKDCLVTLGDGETKPEPNAAVRLLRLSQITSGHYGGGTIGSGLPEVEGEELINHDISSEKLSWLVEAIVEGELSSTKALIVWCRWRRERERLAELLRAKGHPFEEIYGGQSERARNAAITNFQTSKGIPFALLAQPHAGGFGLNLTIASTAIYLSNDYSWAIRAQSEDRMHRTGQTNPCLYIDVVATGPEGQKTVDSAILEALKEKQDLATWTCEKWRKALE